MRDGSCSCSLGFARVQLNQQNPAEVQRTSATRTNAPMRALLLYLFQKKQHNHFICCGPFQSHNSSQLQCANVFFFLIIIVRSEREKKNSDLFEFVGRNYYMSFLACELLWLPFADY